MASSIYTTPGSSEDEIEMIETYNENGSKNQGGGGTTHPDPWE